MQLLTANVDPIHGTFVGRPKRAFTQHCALIGKALNIHGGISVETGHNINSYKFKEEMVPLVRLELTTPSLRMMCSTN